MPRGRGGEDFNSIPGTGALGHGLGHFMWKLPVAIAWQSCGDRVAIVWLSCGDRAVTVCVLVSVDEGWEKHVRAHRDVNTQPHTLHRICTREKERTPMCTRPLFHHFQRTLELQAAPLDPSTTDKQVPRLPRQCCRPEMVILWCSGCILHARFAVEASHIGRFMA